MSRDATVPRNWIRNHKYVLISFEGFKDLIIVVLTAVADDDMPLLNACVNGLGVAVLVILEVVDDVKPSVVAALVAEDDVLPLEAVANADVKVRVPSAVLVNAVSATVEGPGVLVFTALAVLDVNGDELLDSSAVGLRC